MSRVFVVQRPMRTIRDLNQQVVNSVPMFDIAPAAEFGDVRVLIEPGDVALMPHRALKILRDKLSDFGDDDYLIPTGDTVLVGIATAVAAMNNNGCVKMLRWDKRSRMYIDLDYKIYGE